MYPLILYNIVKIINSITRLKKGKIMNKILFVVDMVKGFCNFGNLASKKIASIISNIANHCKKNKNVDNIFLCDAHSENDIEMNVYPIHCLKDSNESEIVDELKSFCQKRVDKNTTNSFFAIDKKCLQKYDEFEIVGCCSDICILQFALSLKTYLNSINQNKDVVVYKDMIATFDLPNHDSTQYHDFAIKLMQQAGIKII